MFRRAGLVKRGAGAQQPVQDLALLLNSELKSSVPWLSWNEAPQLRACLLSPRELAMLQTCQYVGPSVAFVQGRGACSPPSCGVSNNKPPQK